MKRGKIYVMGMDQMVLPLTQHFIQEGSVPTLAKFFSGSAYGQALASLPCWTPNNWAAISTGAQGGTHGASSWFIRMPDGEDVSSLTSLGIIAETIWEAAERQGLKSAVLGCISYFSPDGRQILYRFYCDDTDDLFLMDADASNQTALKPTAMSAKMPPGPRMAGRSSSSSARRQKTGHLRSTAWRWTGRTDRIGSC